MFPIVAWDGIDGEDAFDTGSAWADEREECVLGSESGFQVVRSGMVVPVDDDHSAMGLEVLVAALVEQSGEGDGGEARFFDLCPFGAAHLSDLVNDLGDCLGNAFSVGDALVDGDLLADRVVHVLILLGRSLRTGACGGRWPPRRGAGPVIAAIRSPLLTILP